MALRVTRQYDEVLASGVGKLRVTRQYAEVLTSVYNVENVLSELNLEGVASYYLQAGGTQNIQHDLNLQQDTEWETKFFWVIEHDLNLSQQTDFSIPIKEYVQSNLRLQHLGRGYTGKASSTLQLVQIVGLDKEVEVTSVINFVSEGLRPIIGESELTLNQAVTFGKGSGILETIELISTADHIGIFIRSLSHTSILGHAFTYYIEDACNKKSYGPFIGENTIPNALTPPETTLPIVQTDPSSQLGGCSPTRFTLVYPALGAPISVVTLRAPELDNRDRVSFNRINRETRGGYLTVFADPNWPQKQTLAVTFVGLSKTDIDNLQDFFIDYIGKEINLTDWEGREWIGIITTPNEPAIQNGTDNWNITFEFEGTLIDSNTPDTGLQLTDVVNHNADYTRSIGNTLNLTSDVAYVKV